MIGFVNGVLTLLLIIVFLAIWAWAWSSYNKAPFDRMAQLPLEDHDHPEGDNDVK